MVALVDAESASRAGPFFDVGAAIGMGKQVVSIVPKGIDPGALTLDILARRRLVRNTPEETAEELSNVLQAA